MVVVRVPDKNVGITEASEAKEFLKRIGVDYERWEVKEGLSESTAPLEILSLYSKEIEELKGEGGYVTADVIDINSNTPGLEQMLEKFNKEHFHSEDEVRFTVFGHGIFHIHPDGQDVVAVEVGPGDLLRVPKGTRHWFDLCSDRRIKAVRLFQDASGWVPFYVANGVHARYIPVCFGPAYIKPAKGGKDD